ncbi:MAG: hypothetical protein ACTSVY_06285 [Candidatus Helarchaeota archaeon]
MNKIEGIIEDFNFITPKLEVSLGLFTYYVSKKDINKANQLFNNFLSIIEREPILLARSKRLHESLLQVIGSSEDSKIKEKSNEIIKRIESVFFRLDAKLERLKTISKHEEESTILKEINNIDEELDEFVKINFSILLNTIFNIKNKETSPRYYMDQNSFDNLFKKFSNYLSEIANEINNEDLFHLALKKMEFISINPIKDEILRNIINNYYLLADKIKDEELLQQIFNLSMTIKNKSYWAETLPLYSLILKKSNASEKIIEFLDELILIIQKNPGEFTRSVLLKESLKITRNIKQESLRKVYIQKISNLNERFQGEFSSLLVKIELIKTLYSITKYSQARNVFKEVLKYSGLIYNEELYFRIYKQLINLIPDLPRLINDDLLSFLITKVNETKNPIQKTYQLLFLASKIKDFNMELMKIQKILNGIDEPFFSNNILFTNHIYPILDFSIKNAFQLNNRNILENPQPLFNKIQSPFEKCLLILEFINCLKKTNKNSLVIQYQEMLLEQIGMISNEFQKKEVLLKFIKSF